MAKRGLFSNVRHLFGRDNGNGKSLTSRLILIFELLALMAFPLGVAALIVEYNAAEGEREERARTREIEAWQLLTSDEFVGRGKKQALEYLVEKNQENGLGYNTFDSVNLSKHNLSGLNLPDLHFYCSNLNEASISNSTLENIEMIYSSLSVFSMRKIAGSSASILASYIGDLTYLDFTDADVVIRESVVIGASLRLEHFNEIKTRPDGRPYSRRTFPVNNSILDKTRITVPTYSEDIVSNIKAAGNCLLDERNVPMLITDDNRVEPVALPRCEIDSFNRKLVNFTETHNYKAFRYEELSLQNEVIDNKICNSDSEISWPLFKIQKFLDKQKYRPDVIRNTETDTWSRNYPLDYLVGEKTPVCKDEYKRYTNYYESMCAREEAIDYYDYSKTKTIAEYNQISEAGVIRADFRLGLDYLDQIENKDHLQLANEHFLKAAEYGYDAAQYELGKSYLQGRGVDKDINKALLWFSKAAEQNYPLAFYEIGKLYYEGNDVQSDSYQSLYYLELSAKHGNPEAALLVAKIYEKGDLIVQDMVKAYAYLTLAIAYTYEKDSKVKQEALNRRETLSNRVTGEMLMRANEYAKNLHQR